MTINFRNCLSVAVCLFIGCSSSSGPKLAPVDGVVTFKGKPLAGATVTLIPEKGPFAMGVTGPDGKFTVSTGASRGAVIGSVKVSITEGQAGTGEVTKQPTTPEESEAYMKKAAETQAAIAANGGVAPLPATTIPQKYAKSDTSGLSYTIKATGENRLTIDLVE